MAVTLTPTISLSSTTATGDSLSFSVTKALSLGVNDVRLSKKYIVNDHSAGDAPKIFENANMGKSYIYIKNTHATRTVHFAANATAQITHAEMVLAPGEFAFFPWQGVRDLFAIADADGGEIEVMIFEA